MRYLRITTYKHACTLTKRALERTLEQETQRETASLQRKLKEIRQGLVDRTATPPSDTGGTGDGYVAETAALQDDLDATAEALAFCRSPKQAELMHNAELVEKLSMVDNTVVMHYKKNMDDSVFLPLYPEGVVWLNQVPEGEPPLCEHLSSWQLPPAPNVKSPCSELHDNIVLMIRHDVFTDIEKQDWENWIVDQQKCAGDYAEETPWQFPTAIQIEDVQPAIHDAADQVYACIWYHHPHRA